MFEIWKVCKADLSWSVVSETGVQNEDEYCRDTDLHCSAATLSRAWFLKFDEFSVTRMTSVDGLMEELVKRTCAIIASVSVSTSHCLSSLNLSFIMLNFINRCSGLTFVGIY